MLRVKEHFRSAICKNMGTPGLPEFMRRDLYEPENGGVTRKAVGCVWAIAVRYEHNLEAVFLNTH